jgi:hypothetical protein
MNSIRCFLFFYRLLIYPYFHNLSKELKENENYISII